MSRRSIMLTANWRTRSLLAVAVLAGAIGCDKVNDLVGEVKQDVQKAVTTGVQEVQQEVQKAVNTDHGKITLEIDKPIGASACYASLIRIGSRPTVLQVASYSEPASESYPSFFLRAIAPQAEPSGLIGAPLTAEVFLQETPDGPVWHTADDKLAQVAVTTATPEGFAADLQGVLVNSATGESKDFTGKAQGSFKLVP